MAYLDLSGFKNASVMPDEDVDALHDRYASFFETQLENESAWIDARLRKRYAAPFESPYPKAVVRWLATIVTELAYIKRGVDPNDEQITRIFEAAKEAREEVLEAANSVEGLFDLPLRSDTTATGIAKGGTRSYSEASPYAFTDVQGQRGREEDRNGGGSYG
jgi:hypothetical protein